MLYFFFMAAHYPVGNCSCDHSAWSMKSGISDADILLLPFRSWRIHANSSTYRVLLSVLRPDSQVRRFFFSRDCLNLLPIRVSCPENAVFKMVFDVKISYPQKSTIENGKKTTPS